MFSLGERVLIRKKYLNKNENPDNIYVITNVNAITKRCYIEPETSSLPIKPQELVGFEMLQKF